MGSGDRHDCWLRGWLDGWLAAAWLWARCFSGAGCLALGVHAKPVYGICCAGCIFYFALAAFLVLGVAYCGLQYQTIRRIHLLLLRHSSTWTFGIPFVNHSLRACVSGGAFGVAAAWKLLGGTTVSP